MLYAVMEKESVILTKGSPKSIYTQWDSLEPDMSFTWQEIIKKSQQLFLKGNNIDGINPLMAGWFISFGSSS